MKRELKTETEIVADIRQALVQGAKRSGRAIIHVAGHDVLAAIEGTLPAGHPRRPDKEGR